MELMGHDLNKLGRHAQTAARKQEIRQDKVSEAEFAKQLAAHGIKDYWRDWPKKSRGESWPAPIEKNWELDFAWIELPPHCSACSESLEFEPGMDGGTGGHPSDADPPLPGEWYCPECGTDADLPDESWRSLGIFLDGKAHMFTPGDKLAGAGGKRTADYQRVNVLQHVLGPLGWTVLYFTPSDIGQGVALRSVQAWLSGDGDRLLMALQGKSQ